VRELAPRSISHSLRPPSSRPGPWRDSFGSVLGANASRDDAAMSRPRKMPCPGRRWVPVPRTFLSWRSCITLRWSTGRLRTSNHPSWAGQCRGDHVRTSGHVSIVARARPPPRHDTLSWRATPRARGELPTSDCRLGSPGVPTRRGAHRSLAPGLTMLAAAGLAHDAGRRPVPCYTSRCRFTRVQVDPDPALHHERRVWHFSRQSPQVLSRPGPLVRRDLGPVVAIPPLASLFSS